MKTVIAGPSKYVQGMHELGRLGDYIRTMERGTAYIVASPTALKRYRDSIEAGFAGDKPVFRQFGGECCRREVDDIAAEVTKAGCGVVVGLGGGKALDTAKAVGHQTGAATVIAPSAASSDAPCSALSVLYGEDGTFESYLFLKRNPDLVLVDTAVVAAAPARLLVAGMGDALATYYEARACSRSAATSIAGGACSTTALNLSRTCRDILFADGLRAKLSVEKQAVTAALEHVVEANTYLSGIGFESGGLAGAHAVNNGLTFLDGAHHSMHGEKVAFGTLVQLVLENAPEDELARVLAFCRSVGLPTSLAALGAGEVADAALMKVAEAACAEGDTMGNMPFPVTPEDVMNAIKVADAIGAAL